MTIIKIEKQQYNWIARKAFLRNCWHLYLYVPGSDNPVWMATFRELMHIDAFVNLFERALANIQANPYLSTSIAQYEADEIDATEFVEIMQVYGALPNQIQEVIDRKHATQGYQGEDE